MARNRKKSGFDSIIGFIILIALINSFGGIFGFAFELIFGLLAAVVPIAFVALIVKLIKDASSAKKPGYSRSTTASSSTIQNLLKKLTKYFQSNQRLDIDEDTYLVLANPDNVALNTIDIYIRDEYIGNLKEYNDTYPFAFSSLASELIKYLNKKNKKEPNLAKQEQKEEIAAPIKDSKTDCQYYIDQFTQIQNSISNAEIKNDLGQTIQYLNQINKIENEFTDSKKKTTKLYQYYLPMLKDILTNYKRLEKNATLTEEGKESEDRLLKTIVLINGALKTISSSLVEDYYTEINVDMRTLESILKKDGLVDEMKKEESVNE
ncbi:MAG: hypothetical protein ACI4WG_00275 [Erysipelotrichaceae bacterium]